MRLWLPAIVQMAIIFVLSSIPDLGALPGGASDKSWHSIGYAILGGLVLRALAGGRLRGVTWKTAVLAVVISTAYGATDELHQSFVPGRAPEAADVLADLAGAAAAALLVGAAAVARAWGILGFSSRRDGRESGKVRR